MSRNYDGYIVKEDKCYCKNCGRKVATLREGRIFSMSQDYECSSEGLCSECFWGEKRGEVQEEQAVQDITLEVGFPQMPCDIVVSQLVQDVSRVINKYVGYSCWVIKKDD